MAKEKKFIISKTQSEWGDIFEQKIPNPLEAAEFLKDKQEGLVKNVFVGTNKNSKNSFCVGICWGHGGFGLRKIIEKHIIEHNDFESIEEAMSTIQNSLENGNKKEFPTKYQYDNGKHRLILAKTEEGLLVLTVFDKSKSDEEKTRTNKKQNLKRKELNLLVPNSFTQEGTPLPETVSN